MAHEEPPQGLARAAANDSRYLLDVHRRDLPGQDTMRRYAENRGGRPADRRRRRGRLGARAAPRTQGLADRDPRGRSVLAPRRGLGLRRGRLASAVLEPEADHRRRGPDRARQEQLGARRRRLDGALRRLHAALSSLGLRDLQQGRRGRGLADLLRRAEAPLRGARARAARRRPELAVGGPPLLPVLPAPGQRRGAGSVARRACERASRCAPGPSGSSTARSATARTASTAATACRAARSTRRQARTSPTSPTRSRTASRSARTAWRRASSSTRPAGRSASAYMREGEELERFQRARAVAVCCYSIETPRLLLNSTSPRFPNGLGNDEDQVGRYVMVQGASQSAGRFPEEQRMYKAPPPEVSSEQFYETDERARLRARVLDPDDLPAADRLGRARHRRGPLRPRVARVHARLQPLDDDRRAQRAAAAGREPCDARRRRRTATGMPVAHFAHSRCENDRPTWSTRRASSSAILAGRRRAGRPHDPALRAPDRRRADGHEPREQRRRLATIASGASRTCSSPTAASARPRASANPALTIMALSSRLAELLAAMSDGPLRSAARRMALRPRRRRVMRPSSSTTR